MWACDVGIGQNKDGGKWFITYDHRARRRDNTRPKQMCAENKTLSAFWDIEGVKAHCLLDSGCEGVMISLEFTCATGMRMFELEHPIGLQLACIGSKSNINYGTNTSIKFGTHTINKYFDVANVNFYDAILGTPFLRRPSMVLDFKDQGKILIRNEVIPINFKVVKPEKEERKRPPRLATARATARNTQH
jgi:hypothetical protein